jgi:hypothetical protein
MNFLCKARCWKTFTLLCHVGLTALLYFDQQIEVGRHLIDLDEIGVGDRLLHLLDAGDPFLSGLCHNLHVDIKSV